MVGGKLLFTKEQRPMLFHGIEIRIPFCQGLKNHAIMMIYYSWMDFGGLRSQNIKEVQLEYGAL